MEKYEITKKEETKNKSIFKDVKETKIKSKNMI